MSKITTDDLQKDLDDSQNIDTYLQTNQNELTDKKVSEYLKELLKEKGMTRKQIANTQSTSESYVYQLFQGRRFKPSRNKLLAIAFAMKLNLEQTNRLLKIANLGTLYPRRVRDSIIIFALNKGYDVFECSEMLEQKGLESIIEEVKK